VAYIGPKSRTEKPTKTTIGTEVAHVTRDSVTTFKVKRSKVKVTRTAAFTHQAAAWVNVGTYCYVAVCRRGGRLGGVRRFGDHREERGGGISWRPPAYSLFRVAPWRSGYATVYVVIGLDCDSTSVRLLIKDH